MSEMTEKVAQAILTAMAGEIDEEMYAGGLMSDAALPKLALAAIEAILARLANAVIALWYPLKDEHWLAAWQARAALRLTAPAIALELWLYPRDARVALNGSGLLLINPPYQFDTAARRWQQELRSLLEHARPTAAPPGGEAVRVVVGEREAGHAGA